MRKSVKVAPGVRIRASSRGVSAGMAARNPRGKPVARSSSRSGGPTKASIAAYQRELKAAQREADIEKVAALEQALVSVHKESFPKAERLELPPIDPVDPDPIKRKLEAEAGIPALLTKLGGDEAAPVAIPPEPVDRYELMREHRKRGRQGIPLWKLRERIEAAHQADLESESAAAAEEARRKEAQIAEQTQLDRLWTELQSARSVATERLTAEIRAEEERREAERQAEQTALDQEWKRLQANDPEPTMLALEQAFADNEAPAAPLNCEDDRTAVLMQFKVPEEIVPERKPARTPTGKRTLKKRTKTEINALYLEALGSNVLATVKEAFAVAPGTEIVQILAIREEADKKQAGTMAIVYAGEFDRANYGGGIGATNPGKALAGATDAELNLKGKTEQVAPLNLSQRPDLQSVLTQVTRGLTAG
jgi:hypothetical protein